MISVNTTNLGHCPVCSRIVMNFAHDIATSRLTFHPCRCSAPSAPTLWDRNGQFIAESAPDGQTALASIVGKWPGDETDEQIEEALRHLS